MGLQLGGAEVVLLVGLILNAALFDVFRVLPGYNSPQQVHITQGDHEGKGVIGVQDEPGSSTVLYWSENGKHKYLAKGEVLTYKFYNYTSGYIHHCTINYLKVGSTGTMRQFWFRSPPKVGPDVPYTFGLIDGIHGAGLLREVLLINLG
uniref:Uncharacterized protein n=1 Tax=Nelumbo nucifera TaxID=4432 RepID=A0A822XYG7_NELNU|nr:TPA_asm: hypothetical protein HUJ06_023911 [Nelumbo nucifera]